MRSAGRELQRTGAGDDARRGGESLALVRYAPDGKESTPALVRYLPDGSVDPTFSAASLPPSFPVREITVVEIDSAGRVIVVGTPKPGSGLTGPHVARFTPAGDLDPTFGGGDGVAASGLSSFGFVKRLAFASNGAMFMSGASEIQVGGGATLSPRVAALDGSGEPLPGFESQFVGEKRRGVFNGVAVDSRGRLVLALQDGETLRAVRLFRDGSVDRSYGKDGFADVSTCRVRCETCRRCGDAAMEVAIDAFDRALLVGARFRLARLTADGEPDSGFAPGGWVATRFGRPYTPVADDVLLDATGKPVVVGTRIEGGQRQFALARYGAPSCLTRTATVVGTPGDDRLVGTAGPDVFLAGAGNDRIVAGDGRDLVCAGAGEDTVRAGRGADRAYGQAGPDNLFGGSGRDFLHGGPGTDFLRGGLGRNRLYPGA